MNSEAINPWAVLSGVGSKDFAQRLKSSNKTGVELHREGIRGSTKLNSTIDANDTIIDVEHKPTGKVIPMVVRIRNTEKPVVDSRNRPFKLGDVNRKYQKITKQILKRKVVVDAVELTQRRYNKICRVLDNIRAKNENILNIHKSFRTGENMISENENVKLYHNEYDFYNAFIETLKIDNCACILTYTNKRVKEHSTNIRKLLEYSNDFDKGEFLRCNNYYDSVNVGCLDSLGMVLIMDDIIDFENTEINYTNEYLTYSNNYTTHNLSERGRDYVTYGLKKFELEPMKCHTSTIVEIKK